MRADLAKTSGRLILWDPNNEHRAVGCDFKGTVVEFMRRVASGRAPNRARVWGADAQFRALSQYVHDVGNCTFAVDEAHLFVPNQGDKKHPFRALAVTCRHRKVALSACSWRPVDFPRYLTGAGGSAYVFRTTEGLDLDWYRKNAGKDFAARLPQLTVGKAAIWKR